MGFNAAIAALWYKCEPGFSLRGNCRVRKHVEPGTCSTCDVCPHFCSVPQSQTARQLKAPWTSPPSSTTKTRSPLTPRILSLDEGEDEDEALVDDTDLTELFAPYVEEIDDEMWDSRLFKTPRKRATES